MRDPEPRAFVGHRDVRVRGLVRAAVNLEQRLLSGLERRERGREPALHVRGRDLDTECECRHHLCQRAGGERQLAGPALQRRAHQAKIELAWAEAEQAARLLSYNFV